MLQMLVEILTVAIYGGPPVATLGLGYYLHHKKKQLPAPPENKLAELLEETRQQQAKLASSPVPELEYNPLAFWLYPDWSGGHNLADPGTQPFWMLPPKPPAAAAQPILAALKQITAEQREWPVPAQDAELVYFARRALHYLRMRFAVGGIGIRGFVLQLDKPAKGQVFITFDTWRHNSGTCLLAISTLQEQPEAELDEWRVVTLAPVRVECTHKKHKPQPASGGIREHVF